MIFENPLNQKCFDTLRNGFPPHSVDGNLRENLDTSLGMVCAIEAQNIGFGPVV